MKFLAVGFGYLIGSIPFAYLLARRIGGIDVRLAGSGNVGAANVLRTTGVAGALVVVALDAGKGAATVLLARGLDGGAAVPAAAGLAAILGHIYPVWLRFRGGKGVATACGVFALLAPAAALISAALFVATVWWTRYVSLGSLAAATALAPAAYLTGAPLATVVAAIAAAAIVFERHRANLARLRGGTERRVGQQVSTRDDHGTPQRL